MKIEQLVLKGYKRMSLNHIDSFAYNPKSKVQIILGTNGSGKSSLLAELSPLPANHRMYNTNGYKQIIFTHKGSRYELYSEFGKVQTHSFKKDGVELNTGNGLQTTQTQLVQEHLGLTPKIHALMLGNERFHSMSMADRRYWFTHLSTVNYDYAIGVYNRLKEKIRDISGAIKIAKAKLSIESVKTYSEKEVKALEDKCQILYDLINFMQEHRKPVEQSVDNLAYEAEDILNAMDKECFRIESLIPTTSVRREEISIPRVINEETSTAISILEKDKLLINHYNDEYKKALEQYEKATKSRQSYIDSIKSKFDNFKTEIQKLRQTLKVKVQDVYAPMAIVALIDRISNDIDPIVATLAEHKDKGFNTQIRESLMKSLENTRATLTKTHKEIDKTSHILSHMTKLKNNEPVICPKCKHEWIVGYDEQTYNTLQKSIEILLQDQNKITKDIEAIEQQLQECNTYLSALQAIKDIMRYSSDMTVFWDYIVEQEFIQKDPLNIPFILSQYREDLYILEKIKVYEKELEKLAGELATINNNPDIDFEYIEKIKTDLENKIVLTQVLIQNDKTRVDELKTLQRNIHTLTEYKDNLVGMLEKYNSLKEDSMESLRRQTYNDILRAAQSTLAAYETKLQEIKDSSSYIAKIEQQIKELQYQESKLKAAATALSPTEGLIAEGLFGFMKLFIAQMNEFIKRIWSYPLQILPCSMEKSLELDYKFPVVVDTVDNVRKDISEGSTAMHEVIDLAFMVTAMKALHMDDWPLFLDEFGSAMDPAHKAATIELINSIMLHDNFSQLFMISHDSVQYGALTNTEVVVLSDTGMMLPSTCVYNQNVRINQNVKKKKKQ